LDLTVFSKASLVAINLWFSPAGNSLNSSAYHLDYLVSFSKVIVILVSVTIPQTTPTYLIWPEDVETKVEHLDSSNFVSALLLLPPVYFCNLSIHSLASCLCRRS